MSSEKRFGIRTEPEMSCPRIDRSIKDAKSAESTLNDALRYHGEENAAQLRAAIEDALGDLRDTEAHFEYCRSQYCAIRDWGQEWKDLAKRQADMIENMEYEIEELTERLEKYEPEPTPAVPVANNSTNEPVTTV